MYHEKDTEIGFVLYVSNAVFSLPFEGLLFALYFCPFSELHPEILNYLLSRENSNFHKVFKCIRHQLSASFFLEKVQYILHKFQTKNIRH